MIDMNWGWIVGIIIAVQYAGYGYWYVYTNYIRPFLSYKIVIFDRDDEFVFFRKKKKSIIFGKNKGYLLFNKGSENNGEFYRIPINRVDDKSLSKRDDSGHVTYYYFRNNSNPINIDNKTGITLDNDGRLMANVMKTKMFDSSLMMDRKPIRINWLLIGLALIIMIVVIFHKEIASALNIG
jgi:hypothetical protein